MNFSHTKNQYLTFFKNKNNFIFFKKIKKFKSDPIPEFINIVENNNFSFLYESVEKGKEKGRYSICGYNTIKTIQINNRKKAKEKKLSSTNKNAFLKIDRTISKYKFLKDKKLPPMAGAFFGYISYENIYNIEDISKFKKKNTLMTPELILFIPQILIVYDNVSNSLYILKHFLSGVKKAQEYEQVLNELNVIENNLYKKEKNHTINLNKKKRLKIKSNITKSKFINNIKKAKKYIKAGDIFQVVPSQRFETNFKSKGSSLYKVLRLTNPSPFMYYFNLPNFQIVGSSPEILVRLRSDLLTLRPIAGTRPRGKNIKQDRKYELDLLSDEKETSEHLMLLDLGRNDVGKVAKKSTVSVTAKFIIEKYSHVMHIVSNVVGEYNKKFSKFKALMAGFPAGTVSGAPKIRAMEIIDELEQTKRKIYAGGIGYFSANGDFDTCIALRTAIVKNNKFYVQAGAGIVADSKPINEYKETINKSKALIKALE